jgi:hypothetical protein
LYGSIAVVVLAGLATVLLTPGSTPPPPATMTPPTIEEALATWFPSTDTSIPTLMPSFTPAPAMPGVYEEYTIVILGQDETVVRCWRGTRCGAESHSDVFVIVHVTMSPAPKAVVVLVPRNLYVLPEMMLLSTSPEVWDPLWSMQVYGKYGMDGVHQYVNAVFGLPVQAVFVTKMDRFVEIVDALGGLEIRGKVIDGYEVLAFLRDNDNNWGCQVYDCNGRIFTVAEALRAKSAKDVVMGLLEESLTNVDPLYETDLGYDQVLWMVSKYLAFEMGKGEVQFVRLWTPEVVRSDTPLNVRGMVPTYPLYDWMTATLKVYE